MGAGRGSLGTSTLCAASVATSQPLHGRSQVTAINRRPAMHGSGESSTPGTHAASHATTYGMGPASLAASAGYSIADAERQLATLELKFPRLAAYKKWVRADASRQVIVNAFGRRMRVQPGKEYTQAPAHMGQGTARDLMMEGVLRLPEWLLPGLRAIVHDEIVLSVPEHRADEAEAAVLDALQFAYRIAPDAASVLILADASDRGRDWADCYRSEKKGWPEVARDHRELLTCADLSCTWHTTDKHSNEGKTA